jgi:hypothetical protein
MKLELEQCTIQRDWFTYTWHDDASYCCLARLISGKYYVVFDDFVMDHPLATVDDPDQWIAHSIGILEPDTVTLPASNTSNTDIVGDMVDFFVDME